MDNNQRPPQPPYQQQPYQQQPPQQPYQQQPYQQQYQQQPYNNSSLPSAGVVALIFSFLIPIVGVIIYFVQKDKVNNPNNYLYCALAGFILSFILAI